MVGRLTLSSFSRHGHVGDNPGAPALAPHSTCLHCLPSPLLACVMCFFTLAHLSTPQQVCEAVHILCAPCLLAQCNQVPQRLDITRVCCNYGLIPAQSTAKSTAMVCELPCHAVCETVGVGVCNVPVCWCVRTVRLPQVSASPCRWAADAGLTTTLAYNTQAWSLVASSMTGPSAAMHAWAS